MSSDRSKTIWDRSTPLSQFIAQWVVDDATKSPSVAASPGWQVVDYLAKIASGFFGPEKVPERVRLAVMHGTLIATGWRETPSRSAGPIVIPLNQLSHGRWRLLRDRLESDAFHYRSVRVIDRAALPALLLADRPNQQSRHSEIAKVICSVLASGQLRGKLRKQQIPIVRAALENAGIKNIGTEKTIERLIRLNSKSE